MRSNKSLLGSQLNKLQAAQAKNPSMKDGNVNAGDEVGTGGGGGKEADKALDDVNYRQATVDAKVAAKYKPMRRRDAFFQAQDHFRHRDMVQPRNQHRN